MLYTYTPHLRSTWYTVQILIGLLPYCPCVGVFEKNWHFCSLERTTSRRTDSGTPGAVT